MIERHNPPALHTPPGNHHVTVVGGGRLVFLSGQAPLDGEGRLVGADDPVAQAAQVATNIDRALASAGAAPDDVVRATVYVASPEQADLALVWAALQASPVAAAFTGAATLLGVAQLPYPGQLVEVEVTARVG